MESSKKAGPATLFFRFCSVVIAGYVLIFFKELSFFAGYDLAIDGIVLSKTVLILYTVHYGMKLLCDVTDRYFERVKAWIKKMIS